jgi:hypothetical protein
MNITLYQHHSTTQDMNVFFKSVIENFYISLSFIHHHNNNIIIFSVMNKLQNEEQAQPAAEMF